MRRYNRFENLAQLHAAVETRLSRRLSATEWRMIAPAWVAPYDLSDLKEILQRAKDLPASRQERIRSLRRDVERLRTQLPAYEPRRMHGSPTLGGLTGFGRLYQYVAVGDDDDSDAESVNLLSLYCAIGRMFHEALAVDWLAKRYGLMPSTAQAFLMGLIDAEMAEGITAVSRPAVLLEDALRNPPEGWSRRGESVRTGISSRGEKSSPRPDRYGYRHARGDRAGAIGVWTTCRLAATLGGLRRRTTEMPPRTLQLS
jgi:hypothetical protein